MEEKIKVKQTIHNIIIEGRKKISISGVTEVGNFDENKINVDTSMGILCITGEKLHINKLSIETGDVEVEGTITGCRYNDGEGQKSVGFFGRLLK